MITFISILLLLALAPAFAQERGIFVENGGQWRRGVVLALERPDFRFWLEKGEAWIDMKRGDGGGHVLRQQWIGALGGRAVGVDRADVAMHRVSGRRAWQLGVWNEARLMNLYAGIYARYGADEDGRLKYDLIVSPGSDPSKIAFRYQGAETCSIIAGRLHVGTTAGALIEERPWCYQEISGERHTVQCDFRLVGDTVRFSVGRYDRAYRLVIDPTILLSTYVGGSLLDGATGVDRDSDGNLYVVGSTRSVDFPATPGAYRRSSSGPGSSDVFVARLNPAGSTLLAATYIGGSGNDEGWGIRVAAAGRVVIAGWTASNDFPVTTGVPQPTPGGGGDGFVAVMNGTLNALVASTLCGGTGDDRITDLAIGPDGNPYIVGWTTSSATFPKTPGAFTPPASGGEDAFAVRYSSRLDTLRYATTFGGALADRATGVSVDAAGNGWVAGWTRSVDFSATDSAFSRTLAGGRDAFVVRLRFNGTALDVGTLIGGSGDDEATSVAVDSSGNALITGRTGSSNFPVQPAAMSSPVGTWFAARILWPASTSLGYSRYLGVASDLGYGRTIAVDSSGAAYIAGTTSSSAFPISPDGSSLGPRGGFDIAFIRLSSDGRTVLHSSVVGGGRADSIGGGSHLTRLGDLVVAGTTSSFDFPIGRKAYDSVFNDGIGSFPDGFVMQFAFDRRPSIASVSRLRFDTLACDTVTVDTFQVYNAGEQTLTIYSAIRLVASPRFIVLEPVSPQYPLNIPPGGAIRYVVRFSSSGQGAFRDTLLLTTNDSLAGKQRYMIALEGVRAIPGLSSTPRSIRFTPTLLCAPNGADSAVVIMNEGEGAIRVESATLASGVNFSLGALPLLPRLLLERESFNTPIRFRPATTGLHRDTLIVRFAECPIPVRVPLEGVGDSLSIEFLDDTLAILDLPWCAAAFDTTITIVNRGTRTARVASASFIGSAGFSLLDTLPRQVLPEGSLILRMRVAIPVGSDSARLIIRGDTCALATTLSIVASRKGRDTMVADITSLNFGTGAGCIGDTLLVDSAVVLRNRTPHPILVPPPLITAPFAFRGAPTFPVELGAGDSVVVPVRYAPVVEAFHVGELIVPYISGSCYDTLRIPLFGGRYDERMETDQDTVVFPDLAQCQVSVDTTIILRNTSSLNMEVKRPLSAGGVFALRSFPFTISPLGIDTVTIRYTPMQAGISEARINFIVGTCDLDVPIIVRARKDGVVLIPDGPPQRFPSLLQCELPGTSTATVNIRNIGNVAVDARVISARVEGDPSITVDQSVVGSTIPAGGAVPFKLTFAPDNVGTYVGILNIVTEPCSDTLRVPLEGTVEPVRIDITGLSFGPIPVGLTRLGRMVIRNDNNRPVEIRRIDSVIPPFRIVEILPELPHVIGPGDSIEVTVEFAPKFVGAYSQIAHVVGVTPCVFDLPLPLSGEGAGEGDTVRFCLEGGGAGLVGDTVQASISLLSAPVVLPGQPTIQYHVAYDSRRLQLVDVEGAGAPLNITAATAAGDLRLEQAGVASIGPVQGRVRFRLLAGREDIAHARLTDVELVENGFTPVLCSDSIRWTIMDRCVVTGLALGRYANALDRPLPNPVNETVEINYSQLEDTRAVIRITDISGRDVLRPLDATLAGGRYRLRVDVSDLSSGLYFVVLEAGTYRAFQQLRIQN